MPSGLSLHMGLNAVDPKHYAGWSGDLIACEADARDMRAIARSKGFADTVLMTASATRAAFLAEMNKAASTLKSGDMFLLTYSGHGGSVPDASADENDFQDETWCLFDGQIIDDELDLLFCKFRPGVRILVLSDSCHSGTVIKQLALAAHYGWFPAASLPGAKQRYRNMPTQICLSVYLEHQEFYDKVLAETGKKLKAATLNATVLLISGCQDSQLSRDGTFNGAFTGALKQAWAGGAFTGNYRNFTNEIIKRINLPDQVPNYYLTGANNLVFEVQRPFTL